jgi:CRISPR-associated protein Csm5
VLHTFIETNGKKYIPGSSIKGMLKTIILYSYLENDNHILSDIENEIVNCKDKELFKKLNEFSNTKLSKVISDNESKGLRIIDSSSVDNEYIQVEQIRREHLTDKKSDGLDWLEETIKAETIVPFQIKLFSKDSGDKSHIEEFFQNDFFASVNNYSLILIGVEINLLKLSKFERKNTLIDQLIQLENEIKQSKNKYAICRLGKGKTVYFNVIWPLLKEGIQRKIIHNLFKTDENEQLFPTTRVLTNNDEMLGWIRLKCDLIDGKIPKITEINPQSNEVSEIINQETKIEVTVITPKSVTFFLNSEKYENVQLINPFKIDFSPGEIIQVTVWQLNKIGKINQVKYE